MYCTLVKRSKSCLYIFTSNSGATGLGHLKFVFHFILTLINSTKMPGEVRVLVAFQLTESFLNYFLLSVVLN